MNGMSSRLTPPRVLPLTIAVMLLLLSAKAVTFAKEAGTALGLGSEQALQQPVAPAVSPAASPVPASLARQTATKQVSDSEKALLQDLLRRRQQLDAREHALDERDTVLEATEARLQSKIDHLGALQAKINQLESDRKKRQDANWSGLVKVYEAMKPRDAAAIFNVLDMRVLLQVLDRMNDRKAAAVLAAMQPERARMATQMLAQMRIDQQTLVSQAGTPADTTSSNQK